MLQTPRKAIQEKSRVYLIEEGLILGQTNCAYKWLSFFSSMLLPYSSLNPQVRRLLKKNRNSSADPLHICTPKIWEC